MRMMVPMLASAAAALYSAYRWAQRASNAALVAAAGATTLVASILGEMGERALPWMFFMGAVLVLIWTFGARLWSEIASGWGGPSPGRDRRECAPPSAAGPSAKPRCFGGASPASGPIGPGGTWHTGRLGRSHGSGSRDSGASAGGGEWDQLSAQFLASRAWPPFC